jgi:hypothetical protein
LQHLAVDSSDCLQRVAAIDRQIQGNLLHFKPRFVISDLFFIKCSLFHKSIFFCFSLTLHDNLSTKPDTLALRTTTKKKIYQ